MLVNKEYIKKFLTNNDTEPVSYRWTHGATDEHLGDGLLIYSIIQFMRAKVCVCLGSGGGFIPRIMTQSRVDLYDSQIFEGDRDFNWGDIGTTYLVDASNGVGGNTDWIKKDSFFRKTFFPRVILEKESQTVSNSYIYTKMVIYQQHLLINKVNFMEKQ